MVRRSMLCRGEIIFFHIPSLLYLYKIRLYILKNSTLRAIIVSGREYLNLPLLHYRDQLLHLNLI